MPARVKVRAVIWVGDLLVVHRVNLRGQLRVTLPGGRVNERESVSDALQREVREELGIEIEIGDLLFAAEVMSGARIQDVELVFAARAKTEIDTTRVELIDPAERTMVVLPPVLDEIARARRGEPGTRWLGNVYRSAANTEAEAAGK